MSFFIYSTADPRLSLVDPALIDRSYIIPSGTYGNPARYYVSAHYQNKTYAMSSQSNELLRFIPSRVASTAPTARYRITTQRYGLDYRLASTNSTATPSTTLSTFVLPPALSTTNEQLWEVVMDTATASAIFHVYDSVLNPNPTRMWFTGDPADAINFRPPLIPAAMLNLSFGVQLRPVAPTTPSVKNLVVDALTAGLPGTSTFPLANVVSPTPDIAKFVMRPDVATGPVITNRPYFLRDSNGKFLTARPDPTAPTLYYALIPQDKASPVNDNQLFTFTPYSVPTATNPFYSYVITTTINEPGGSKIPIFVSIVEDEYGVYYIDPIRTTDPITGSPRIPYVWEEFQIRPTLDSLGRFKILCPYWSGGICIEALAAGDMCEAVPGTSTDAGCYFGFETQTYVGEMMADCNGGGLLLPPPPPPPLPSSASSSPSATSTTATNSTTSTIASADNDDLQNTPASHTYLLYRDLETARARGVVLLSDKVGGAITTLKVLGPIGAASHCNEEDISLDGMLFTAGALSAYEKQNNNNNNNAAPAAAANPNPFVPTTDPADEMMSECPRFYFDQTCDKGEACTFIHRFSICGSLPETAPTLLATNYFAREAILSNAKKPVRDVCERAINREMRCNAAKARGGRRLLVKEVYAERRFRSKEKAAREVYKKIAAKL